MLLVLLLLFFRSVSIFVMSTPTAGCISAGLSSANSALRSLSFSLYSSACALSRFLEARV